MNYRPRPLASANSSSGGPQHLDAASFDFRPERCEVHYENMPIQTPENCTTKDKKKHFFSNKKTSDIFHISAQNIACEYSLEPPRRGGSNEYHNLCFSAKIRKIMYTPVNLSFTI